MRSHPKVCVQVDEIRSQSHWVSVIAYGEFRELRETQFEDERAMPAVSSKGTIIGG